MATHSSILAWEIPWMEEPGRLHSMVSLRVGHNWATSLSLFTFMHWRRKWQPTPVFLPGESQGRGSLVGWCLGSYRVGHDWSDLAAAAADPYPISSNFRDSYWRTFLFWHFVLIYTHVRFLLSGLDSVFVFQSHKLCDNWVNLFLAQKDQGIPLEIIKLLRTLKYTGFMFTLLVDNFKG